ncbi:LuxR C-terminal-related transcriptional regulator [Pseudarthrobacter sp. J64]|uniref:LuxR C-terminal-related transcriptional regulator n=1 Tax=Pseudarthrobacter sp. J64 TaxID=3116485 RepID=UPI002E8025F1|nr:LuxR C-terminal-related transcriptional regulator [Pseudarthrobacter sp. J64]MEE2569307.1 LuxR C-terminal-related transcriptional regulator [Pseudarthrobacter sp. J64]
MDRAGGLMVGRVPQAVFVMAGPGIGKSLFLDAVTERLAGASIVERIHASPSLKHVPFGILAPFTSGLTGEEAASPVAVLRSVWLHFQRLKAGREWPVVLVVDDAHHLDESSAAILVDMVAAGWSSVMVAARPRPGLPQPLDQLWYDGLAERIDLHPLDRQQLAETLSAMLESPVPASLSGAFWVATEGNPLLVGCLLKDARTAGVLAKRNDLWQLAGPLPADGTELTAHVAREVARRSPEEQEALRIIALAGPVNRRSVEELCSADIVRELMDQHLVVDSGGHPSELSIRHPIMGEAIRRQVNVSRSLHLRQKLHQVPGLVVASEGGHLRHVEWALECGQAVKDADLLRAALIALRSHRSTSAVRLAGRIATGSQAPLARAVSARARFNMGDYSAARTLLEHAWTGLPDTDAVAAAMLRAAACMASGVLLEDVLATGADLPAGVDPSQGRVMELVSTVGPRALSDEPVCGVLEEAFLAEDLADRGQLHAALEHVVNAAAAAPTVDNTLFFFEEFVLFRAVCVYLGMGEWTAVERELGGYGDRHGGVPGIFEGTMETLRGYSCIRQGKVEQAVGILFPAVELLRQSDPLQLCRFSTSLAFYAAARLGDKAQARRLAADLKSVTHIDRPGTGLRATAYIHAGSELLERDGKGLAALREHVTRPEVSSRPAVVLECLLLATELGEDTLMEAIHQAAAGMDGRWAEAVAGLALRWRGDDPAALLEEANSLVSAGFVNLARAAYQRAGALLHNADDARRFRQAVSLREKCDDLLGLKSRDGTTAQAPGIRLTRRERDIAELAAQGLSDKDIAQRLMVSVRTVEGHLYRTYVKLGVRSREELAPVLPRNAG